MLEIPASLNRNAKGVQDMGTPEETGRMLMDYMCQRIGIEGLAGLDVLDMGCGVRFTQSILNLELPIGSYFGVDVDPKVTDFLIENVTDPRFSFLRIDVANTLYNGQGAPLDPEAPSPFDSAVFDIACMFSVITHQNPAEAVPTFRLLRRHIKPSGHMFFSAFIHDETDLDYKERVPERPGNQSSYSLPYMTGLLADSGWEILSVVDPVPDGLPIMNSFLCKPV